jgi:ABC-type multidrug transport system ATPase subunit
VGVNGAGKSTLLALLAGRLAPDAGRVKRGKTVAVAELSQAGSELDELADLTAVQVIEAERRTFTLTKENPAFLGRTAGGGAIGELTAGQLVERLGFTRERAHTRVRELSGGERRRLQLARLLVQGPNVLLLDEPTNDLDTDTLAAIEDLLDGFSGTLIVVSHDRYLLERVADRQWAMYGDGRIVDLPGGVEEYLAVRRKGTADNLVKGNNAPVASLPSAAPSASASAAEIRQARKDIARIEKRLNKIAEEQGKLHETIANNPTDYTGVAQADTKLRALDQERADLEEAWLLAAEVAAE